MRSLMLVTVLRRPMEMPKRVLVTSASCCKTLKRAVQMTAAQRRLLMRRRLTAVTSASCFR